LEALSHVHQLRQVAVWSPQKLHRDRFVEEARTATSAITGSDPMDALMESDLKEGAKTAVWGSDPKITAAAHAGEAVVGADIVAELGELVNGAAGRTSATDVTIFKSLGLAVEDVTAADLAYRRAVDQGIGTELAL